MLIVSHIPLGSKSLEQMHKQNLKTTNIFNRINNQDSAGNCNYYDV